MYNRENFVTRKADSRAKLVLVVFLIFAFFTTWGCTYTSEQPEIKGRDIRLTILHTSDIHSRITSYEHIPIYTEEQLGLVADRGPYGGIAKIATIIKRERAASGRVLHLDSGDLFQGAPIFNLFKGEPELRTLSFVGVDAFALGNHEFDFGPENVVSQFEQWAEFPVLAANYMWNETETPFADAFQTLIHPFTFFNLHGLKVSVIGMGNLSSMTSLDDADNSAGILPLNTLQTVQDYVNILRDSSDVVIVLSHMGLNHDEIIGQNVCGVDMIVGGHHHIALNPPKIIPYDPDPEYVKEIDSIGTCSNEWKRNPILVHSHAFSKFVGRLDIVVRDGRIRAHKFKLFPVDNTIPDDAETWEILEPYYEQLLREYDLDMVIATANADLSRFGANGGDSRLGNLVAEAIQYRRGIETDFAVTNSLGVRMDIQEGPINIETMFNVMPFENTITTMYMSGLEVQEMLDYSTDRSSGRGCNSQIQISNATFKMNCRTGLAEDITIAGQPLRLDSIYEMATNNYIAWGGSGFDVLKRNTTKIDTGISLRDAVIDYMREHPDLPECYENVENIDDCHDGIAVEDGRITPLY